MVGKAIGEYLKEKGIKQTYLAEKIGVTPSVMSDICNKSKRIDCLVYYKICTVLDVPYDFFIEKTLKTND